MTVYYGGENSSFLGKGFPLPLGSVPGVAGNSGTVTNGAWFSPFKIPCLIPEIELLGAPKGRRRIAQGVSPGNTYSNKGSPERAKQLVRVLKSISLNPGLTPWAVLPDPFGVLI